MSFYDLIAPAAKPRRRDTEKTAWQEWTPIPETLAAVLPREVMDRLKTTTQQTRNQRPEEK
ncbi:hypothetical protein DBT52_09640 [Aerococcus mictus]|nr:hypothetical protein DBT52_09640 [Aerococcus mictus]